MEFYLQFGYGMMSLTRDMIERWGEVNVILSPRDLKSDQITRFPNEIKDGLNDCLIDPQFYLPRADHHRLINHDYWPNDYTTNLLYNGIEENLKELKKLNDQANTTKYILPSILCTQVDDVWIKNINQIIDLSKNIFEDKPKIATLPLVQEVVRDERSIEEILNIVEEWNVDGFYVVAEPPQNQYLIDDPLWIKNLLNLLAGLKLLDKFVVVGYCSHQLLCAFITNIDGIASGTWLNVRSFPPDKFKEQEKDVRQRGLWYYCPQTFSEYKIQYLDTAYSDGVLDKLKPSSEYLNKYIKPIFSGALPSDTDYSESNSQRHYIDTLKNQTDNLSATSFSEAFNNYMDMLKKYKKNSDELFNEGIFGQHRDFNEIFEANMSAIISLRKKRGFVMDRKWGSLSYDQN